MKKALTIIALFALTNCFGQSNGQPEYRWLSTDTVKITKAVTKDTIEVPVLCYKKSANEIFAWELANDKTDPFRGVAAIEFVQVERTFEKQKIPCSVIWELKEVSTRYLENVDGCFQLTPIKNDK